MTGIGEKFLDDKAALPPSESRATVQPLRANPPKLAYSPRILDVFREAVSRCGVVGEETTAATIYLLLTSRLLDKPVSAAIKGNSSSGKSYTAETTVKFFPPNAVVEMTAMSERALIYDSREYKHRTLVLYEATALREGAEDNLTAYFVRSLLSEGRIEYPVTVRDKENGGFTTKTIVKEGPTNLIVTTTKTRVHAENETRLLSLTTDDTREQTSRIFQALADESGKSVNMEEWHALQNWLQTVETRVTIPYAKWLADNVPPIAIRLRRDFGNLLSLIRTHAILHQATRERTDDGTIIASEDDYTVVRELVGPIIAEGVQATVSEQVRETIQAVETLEDESGIQAKDVAELLNLDKGTVSRRLKQAADGGWIINQEDRRGKPGRWKMGEPLPEDKELLPQLCNRNTSESPVISDGCTVAGSSEGNIGMENICPACKGEGDECRHCTGTGRL